MAVKLGTDGISRMQSQLLEVAKRLVTASDAAPGLVEVLTDPDILSGQESLHPDWLPIYASSRDFLPERLKSIGDSLAPTSPAMAEIDARTLRTCFLLGAGASKPKPSEIPTVKELLPDLLARGRRLDRDDVTRLADFCDRSGISNIEDLLTAAQVSEFCAKNRSVLRLVEFLLYRDGADSDRDDVDFVRLAPARRRRPPVDVSSVALLQDTLQVLFGLLSSRMLPAEPNAAHQAISAFAKEHTNAAIVTTNYDCCMDRALTAGGSEFTYSVDFGSSGLVEDDTDSCIPLIKLHGSLNWFYCETCQHVNLLDIEKTIKNYKSNESLYPVIGVCKDCGGQRRGLLVPPLAMKFDVAPPLNRLLDRADQLFSKAELLIVVGFSFADADLYLTRMLAKAMQDTNKRLLVVDPDSAVVDKIGRRLSARIPNFHKTRIVSTKLGCEEFLPKFLSGALLKGAEPAAEVQPLTNAPNGNPAVSD
jgi:NAD-dependent SIR2 family protein deacetylase